MSFSFIFTICFVLIGPIKIIPAFAKLTRGQDRTFRHRLAIEGALVAAAICLFILLAGNQLVTTYRLSVDALRITGGLVLLLTALRGIFVSAQAPPPPEKQRTTLQIAISPLATPTIVAPAGIAAILIFATLAPGYPGMIEALALSLAIVLALDFLVMVFNPRLIKLPGLIPVLQVLGVVLLFVQAALGVDTMLHGLESWRLAAG